jgi:immune inhibitor A
VAFSPAASFPRICSAIAVAIAVLAPAYARATMPTAAGSVPAELREAFSAGLFTVPAPPDPLSTSSVQTTWRVPVIMIGFSDMPLTYSPQTLERQLFDRTGAVPTGSAAQYYDWVSEGRLTLTGEVVFAVQLPNTREYYAFNAWGVNSISTPNNIYGMIRDALFKARADGLQVDWSRYDLDNDTQVDMLWVVHAGPGGESLPDDRNNIWSITSRLSTGWRLGTWFETDDLVPGSQTHYIRVDRFSTMPELSGEVPGALSEIGVYCHEFGHALGLPDLYDTSQLGGAANSGPGNWSLMSTGAFGANGASPETPSHMGAWPMLFLGWRQAVRPARDTVMTLPPLEQGGDIVEFWFQGESNPEHFLIENRQPLGFDQNIPDRGMILYQVDEAVIGARLTSNRINAGLTPGLMLVEADGDSDLVVGRNRGDGLDPFPGGLQVRSIDETTTPSTRSFRDGVTNIGIYDIANSGFDLSLRLQVEAPGWLNIEDHTIGEFTPIEFGTSPDFAADERGFQHTVRSELRSGRSQVMLRSAQDDLWAAPIQLSFTTGVALDPVIVALPGGDLVVVWSDTREGPARLFYRARIRGAWTPEQAITNLPGDARNPAIARAADGTLHLTWLQVGTPPRLMFMRFLYPSPFGAAIAVTDSLSPGPPVLATGPDGGSYIVWTERGMVPNQVQFARFHPDSGMGPRWPLAPRSFGAQSAPQAVVDANGTMHSVWIESNTGVNRIRYQHRQKMGFPNPADLTIVQHGNSIENPVLAASPEGTLHLVYERNLDGLLQLRYMRWREPRGWDLVGTNVSGVPEGDATSPGLLVAGPGDVSVFFTGHPQGAPRFNLKRRMLEEVMPPPPVAIAPPSAGGGGLLAWPNPLRAGSALSFRIPGATAPGIVDVFDLGGRRIGSATLGASGVPGFARIDGLETHAWSAGVYFARPRGSNGATRIVILR